MSWPAAGLSMEGEEQRQARAACLSRQAVSDPLIPTHLIRDGTFCNSDFAKCAVVEGTEVRVGLSLDEIEEIQGYVAAEANHTKNSKRRKELDRLFGKLQVFLDTYDEQSE
ncbi:MAG: hypothetical protein P0121_14855 [Nitrospira sp.]|nr:hypothetical protein [Nitrospira sp.]